MVQAQKVAVLEKGLAAVERDLPTVARDLNEHVQDKDAHRVHTCDKGDDVARHEAQIKGLMAWRGGLVGGIVTVALFVAGWFISVAAADASAAVQLEALQPVPREVAAQEARLEALESRAAEDRAKLQSTVDSIPERVAGEVTRRKGVDQVRAAVYTLDELRPDERRRIETILETAAAREP